MALRITTTNKLGLAIMEARGSIIGGSETDELKSAAGDLLEQGNRKLLIDLSGTGYVNSAGLGAVVAIHTMYTKAGGQLVLCGLDRGVHNVFVLTSLTRVIDVAETRAAGLSRLKNTH